jgi:hypothetical protein
MIEDEREESGSPVAVLKSNFSVASEILNSSGQHNREGRRKIAMWSLLTLDLSGKLEGFT